MVGLTMLSGRPYQEERVTHPSLACDSYISFVFDAGADSTTLVLQIIAFELSEKDSRISAEHDCYRAIEAQS